METIVLEQPVTVQSLIQALEKIENKNIKIRVGADMTSFDIEEVYYYKDKSCYIDCHQ